MFSRLIYNNLTPVGSAEIYVAGADGSSPAPVTTDSAFDNEPTWSPDGTQIAFHRVEAGNDDVWIMNADGSGQRNLTRSAGVDSQPAWSPDGRRIAFTSTRDQALGEIYVMDRDGSHRTRLTTNSQYDADPAFSPDGARIAFTRLTADLGHDIFLMNADGSNQTDLTRLAGVEAEPSWSPGGRIAFVHSDPYDIFVIDSTGRTATNLTNSPANESMAAWSPPPVPGAGFRPRESRGRGGEWRTQSATRTIPWPRRAAGRTIPRPRSGPRTMRSACAAVPRRRPWTRPGSSSAGCVRRNRERAGAVDVVVAEAGIEEVDLLEPLWLSMVEHHRELTAHEWPVRDASEAWARRRRQYLDWLSDGTGTLFTAAVQPSPELVGYAMLRVTPPGPTWALGAEMGEVESLAVVEPRAARESAPHCSRPVARRSRNGVSSTGRWPSLSRTPER